MKLTQLVLTTKHIFETDLSIVATAELSLCLQFLPGPKLKFITLGLFS